STSAALAAATTATWNPTWNSNTNGGWSAGEMSWNWTNGPTYISGNYTHATQGGPDFQNLTTYYNANSVGHETGGNGSTILSTYTYTVPFQTYQFNPGSTINQAVGLTVTGQLAAATDAYAGEKITLPSNWVSNGSTSGTIEEVSHTENIASSSAYGFTTTGFNLQKSFDDGASGNTVQDGVPGVFYNYGASTLSNQDPMLSTASSASTDTVTLEGSFGPTYVAWTAPSGGTVAINMNAWDLGYDNSTNDGVPSLYVISSTAGPTAPLMYVSNLANVGNGNQVSGRNVPWASANNYGSTVGTVGLTAGNLTGYTAASGFQAGANWTATFSVTSGEVLYFVDDANHTNGNAHSYEGSQDPIALQDQINFTPTPEPASVVLGALGGIGLLVVGWKRRRAA
ncbi:MAG TPA: hypothetical protein VMF30_12940, partial [Pirellulales bacterium]|nr:hypothetical protein [Pirellulales bacterium]